MDVADLIAAAAAFAATDVDDLVLLTLLFALTRRPGTALTGTHVVVGQLLGVGALLAVSALVAFGLLRVDDDLIGLLGLIPLALGLRALVALLRQEGGEEAPEALPTRGGPLAVAAITVANGADNVAVYVPLLGRAGPEGLPLTAVVFAVGVLVWCWAGRWLGTRPATLRGVERWGDRLVPAVLIALGAVILLEAYA